MARFPYYRHNVKDLGRLIAQASQDASFRATLENDPATALTKIGLPQQTVELLKFKVVDEKTVPNAVALPFRLNQTKVENKDEAYLQSLGKSFALN